MIEIKYKDETLYFESLEAANDYVEKLDQKIRSLNETMKPELAKLAILEEKKDLIDQLMLKSIMKKHQCSEEKAYEIAVEYFKKEHGSVPSKFLNYRK